MTIQPVYSEKSLDNARKNNVYTFSLRYSPLKKISTSKIQKQIEKQYGVRVLSVNSQVRLGKEKRFGSSKKTYYTPSLKFYYVRLAKNDSIKDFNIDDKD